MSQWGDGGGIGDLIRKVASCLESGWRSSPWHDDLRDLVHRLERVAGSAAAGQSWRSAPWHDDLRRLVDRLEAGNGPGRAYASGRGPDDQDLHGLVRRLEVAVQGGKGGQQSQSHQVHSAFWLGAASGAALMMAAPYLKRKLRPVVRQTIKGGLIVGRQLQEATAAAREDLEDLASEAKAELETNAGARGNGKEEGGGKA